VVRAAGVPPQGLEP